MCCHIMLVSHTCTVYMSVGPQIFECQSINLRLSSKVTDYTVIQLIYYIMTAQQLTFPTSYWHQGNHSSRFVLINEQQQNDDTTHHYRHHQTSSASLIIYHVMTLHLGSLDKPCEHVWNETMILLNWKSLH